MTFFYYSAVELGIPASVGPFRRQALRGRLFSFRPAKKTLSLPSFESLAGLFLPTWPSKHSPRPPPLFFLLLPRLMSGRRRTFLAPPPQTETRPQAPHTNTRTQMGGKIGLRKEEEKLSDANGGGKTMPGAVFRYFHLLSRLPTLIDANYAEGNAGKPLQHKTSVTPL